MIRDANGRRTLGKVLHKTVTMAHGSGGKAMHDFIDDVFVAAFHHDPYAPLQDQARLDLAALARHGDRLAFTTDSYVVTPLEFPGGDIGKLAVCGTINDLAVGGAIPLFSSCAVIVEEGVPVDLIRRLARSMAATAAAAGVKVVTGDTKVVERGACDKLFINTTGIGVIRTGVELGVERARPGDVVIVNGVIGDHGATILAARGNIPLEGELVSDCAPLHGLIATLLEAAPGTRFLRDATRGGLATVLVEIARASGVGIEICERQIPIRPAVRGFCELLGLDPLYLANEGKLVCIVPEREANAAVHALRGHPFGVDAAVIGQVSATRPGQVVLTTVLGGQRFVDTLVGEQLPRIC